MSTGHDGECPHCHSVRTTQLPHKTSPGYGTFRCSVCCRKFSERAGTPVNHLQFPTDIVLLIVLGDCAINSLFVTLQKCFWRGVSCSSRKFYAIVAVRDWEARFAPFITEQLRARRRSKAGRSWYTDETYVKVGGKWPYPYRAIDRAGSSLRKAAHEPENGFVAIRHSVASTAGIRNETMPELMIQGRVRYRGQMEATSRARSGSCRWHSNWLPDSSPSFVSACHRLVEFSCCNATLFSVP
jgi:hypothetical protein